MGPLFVGDYSRNELETYLLIQQGDVSAQYVWMWPFFPMLKVTNNQRVSDFHPPIVRILTPSTKKLKSTALDSPNLSYPQYFFNKQSNKQFKLPQDLSGLKTSVAQAAFDLSIPRFATSGFPTFPHTSHRKSTFKCLDEHIQRRRVCVKMVAKIDGFPPVALEHNSLGQHEPWRCKEIPRPLAFL